MVGPAAKRQAVRRCVEQGKGSVAQACRAMNLNRSTFYLKFQVSETSQQQRKRVIELSKEKPRYGYRRITALLKRENEPVNAKRVRRIRGEEGLQVRKRQRRLRRVGPTESKRRVATYPGEVWSWDFVSDQMANGSRFRILTLIDEYTRQCLALQAGWTIRATDAIAVIAKAMATYGNPTHLRSDNGPEFMAHQLQDWLKAKQVKTLYITTGSPWEQAWIESFHDKLRDELLNREWFTSLLQTQCLLNQWRCEFNEDRPHSSLANQTPEEFAAHYSAKTNLQNGTRSVPPAALVSPQGGRHQSTSEGSPPITRTQTTNTAFSSIDSKTTQALQMPHDSSF